MLMVRVVAANFRASGGAEQCLRLALESLYKAGQDLGAAGAGVFRVVLTVKADQRLLKRGLMDAFFQINEFHSLSLLVVLILNVPVPGLSFHVLPSPNTWIFVAKPITRRYDEEK